MNKILVYAYAPYGTSPNAIFVIKGIPEELKQVIEDNPLGVEPIICDSLEYNVHINALVARKDHLEIQIRNQPVTLHYIHENTD